MFQYIIYGLKSDKHNQIVEESLKSVNLFNGGVVDKQIEWRHEKEAQCCPFINWRSQAHSMEEAEHLCDR